MPHIKLEHTKNIQLRRIRSVFKQIKNILLKNAGVKEKYCKCKAILIPTYAVGGDENSNHFFHLEISFLKGRTEKVRQKIGRKSLQVLKEYLMDENDDNLKQFSVEIREIKSENYITSNAI